jgi:hypothetical protein
MSYVTRTDPMRHFSHEPLIAWQNRHELKGQCKCGVIKEEHALRCQLGHDGYSLRCACGKDIKMVNNPYSEK